jgi:hypothetical protein
MSNVDGPRSCSKPAVEDSSWAPDRREDQSVVEESAQGRMLDMQSFDFYLSFRQGNLNSCSLCIRGSTSPPTHLVDGRIIDSMVYRETLELSVMVEDGLCHLVVDRN